MGFPIFLVLEKNQCFRYISCATFLLVRCFGLFVIFQFCGVDLLKSTKELNLQNNYYTN